MLVVFPSYIYLTPARKFDCRSIVKFGEYGLINLHDVPITTGSVRSGGRACAWYRSACHPKEGTMQETTWESGENRDEVGTFDVQILLSWFFDSDATDDSQARVDTQEAA